MSDPAANRREEFLRALRRRFSRLRGRLRRWLGYEEDIFGLAADGGQPTDRDELDDDAPQVFRFNTRRENVAAFQRWLGRQVEQDILEPVGPRERQNGEHWTAEHIRGTYIQGWRESRSRLRNVGVAVGPDVDPQEVVRVPIARRTLRRMYTRTYANLQSVTTDIADPVRETLTEGLAKGWNPRKTADELTERVREIQHTRAETLARTETIATYSDATIDRYRRAGIDAVQHGEWSDASDSRVCPICEQLDGREIPIANIDSETFTFEPSESEPDHLAGEYPLKPPAHPNGRCVLLPVIS